MRLERERLRGRSSEVEPDSFLLDLTLDGGLVLGRVIDTFFLICS
jgi:hypothetical protein